jgi:dipeptidyl aminopeptidase/acylaminoacyl peptidase
VELQVCFLSGNEKVFGVWHYPEKVETYPVVVLCHGFGGNKTEAHRIFVRLARNLEKRGLAVLRFDFRGSGDSQGEFKDITVTREMEDVLSALDFVERQPRVDKERIGILGFSLGGYVAALAASKDKRIKSLALWSAVARPSRKFTCDQKSLSEWRRTGKLDISGNILGYNFFKDLQKHDPFRVLRGYQGPVLAVHGSADEVTEPADSREFHDRFKANNNPCELRIISGADHVFSSEAHETEAVEFTSQWFQQSLRKKNGQKSSRRRR